MTAARHRDDAGRRRTGRVRGRVDGDDGQVMILALAFGLLAILLVTVVVSATAVHLERKRLLALADLAALEAADAVDPARYYGAPGPQDVLLPLTEEDVRASVEEYLSTAPAAVAFEDLEIVRATTEDGRTAVVTLRAVARLPLLSVATAGWSDGVELVVTSRARAD